MNIQIIILSLLNKSVKMYMPETSDPLPLNLQIFRIFELTNKRKDPAGFGEN